MKVPRLEDNDVASLNLQRLRCPCDEDVRHDKRQTCKSFQQTILLQQTARQRLHRFLRLWVLEETWIVPKELSQCSSTAAHNLEITRIPATEDRS